MRGLVILLFLLQLLLFFVLPSRVEAIEPAAMDVADNVIYTRPLPAGILIDSIAVHKATHEMLVFNNHRLLKKYKVQLGLCPVGNKQCNGDYKTPEGLYTINIKNLNSQFHKSLGISYPNAADLERARKTGKLPGGDIMIHGLPNGEENAGPDRYQNDWTWGCISVRNSEIDELFTHINVDTPILITP